MPHQSISIQASSANVLRPTALVRWIGQLPFGRRLVFRIYNRLLIELSPAKRAETYFGAEFDCNMNDLIGSTLVYFGSWEPNTSKVVAHIIRPGDVVVDLGANIGYFTLLFSKLVGDTGKVIAVEALPKIAARLTENARRNSAANVEVVNVAAAAYRGTAPIYEGPAKNIGASTIRADRGFMQSGVVETRPIDQIVSDEDAKRTSLVKIDIEGAEVPIVERILDSLERYSPRLSIIVEINTTQNPEWRDLFERFLAKGFMAYDLANNYVWLNLIDGIDAQPRRVDAIPASGNADILFTRANISID